MNKILYFGYGAYRSKSRISQVTGDDPGEGVGGILEGYRLAYQTLSEIPSPAKEALNKVWGPDFKAYTAVKGNGVISGILWNVTDEGFQVIKEWEFIGVWREIIELEVKTSDGMVIKAFTDKAFDSHPVSGYVDGLMYNEFNFRNQGEIEKLKEEKYYTDEKLEEIRQSLATIGK